MAKIFRPFEFKTEAAGGQNNNGMGKSVLRIRLPTIRKQERKDMTINFLECSLKRGFQNKRPHSPKSTLNFPTLTEVLSLFIYFKFPLCP